MSQFVSTPASGDRIATSAGTHTSAANSEDYLKPIESAPPINIQTKLTVGSPDDPLEEEADSMADQVMRMPDNSFIQRRCHECEKEDEVQNKSSSDKALPSIQKKGAGNSSVSEATSGSIRATLGFGSRLDKQTNNFMSQRFGHNFNDVKIHNDGHAAQLSDNLQAKAFTVGKDIYFNQNQYNPRSADGRHLLAHELTHVVQQGGGMMKVQRVPHTYTFLSRESYGVTFPGFTPPSCTAGAAPGTSTIVAGSASPTVTVFPNGTYRVRRDDGVEQTAVCPRSAAGLALTTAHENSHAAGARAGALAANTAQGLPRNFADAAACSAALPGIVAAWNTSVNAAWAIEVSHGPGTNQPTAQTFTDEHAAGTCTFT